MWYYVYTFYLIKPWKKDMESLATVFFCIVHSSFWTLMGICFLGLPIGLMYEWKYCDTKYLLSDTQLATPDVL